MAKFVVIGLGIFGSTVAKELMRLRHEVLGVDINPKLVNQISNDITQAVIADATDSKVLEELQVQDFEAVIVAIGENLEASLLCTLHLKSLNVQQLLVKTKTKAHHAIISQIGVDRIIHPEEDMGIKVAQSLNYPMVMDYIAIGDNTFVISVCVRNMRIAGGRVSDIIEKYPEVHVLMIKRKSIILKIQPDTVIIERDVLVLSGTLPDLEKIRPYFAALSQN